MILVLLIVFITSVFGQTVNTECGPVKGLGEILFFFRCFSKKIDFNRKKDQLIVIN